MSLRRRFAKPLLLAAVLAVALAAAGCSVAGFGSLTGMLAALGLSLFVLFGVACTERVPGGGGGWSACCNNGKIDTCYCPPNAACNYGWFADCGDGTCSEPGGRCSPDTGLPTDGPLEAGAWESCCDNGKISTCWCPANTACNYGQYDKCADGTCSYGGCKNPVDAGLDVTDLGGTWDPCCQNGKISTCYCPPGAICNYYYQPCSATTCADPGQSCPDGGVSDAGPPDAPTLDANPVDGGAPDQAAVQDGSVAADTQTDAGTWEPCCVNSAITTCFCPAGVACNYGQYQDCGNGTCVFFTQTCP
ncbi:MAG: hypothetical protein KC503_32090 [Myxococcales bacterium]|nr:hypothetical protein [Myxococcales bacterium]